jgi:hypothetical protein
MAVKKEKKARAAKVLHPKSRKFKQQNRALERAAKLKNRPKSLHRQAELQDRVGYCKDHVNMTDEVTEETMQGLIEDFINRSSTDIEGLEVERQERGRPKTNRQESLERQQGHEIQEWKSGFAMPNLLDPKCKELLLNGVQVERLAFTRFTKL